LQLKSSKKSFYIKYFNNNLNNIKNTWKGIKEVINIKSTSHNAPTQLNLNENIITDHTTVSNIFNNYFISVNKKLHSQIRPIKHKFRDFLNMPNTNSLFIDPVSEDEVSNLINNTLKNNTSHGPNSIPSFFLKLTSHIISKPLCTIINNSFKSGTFPDVFKVARVVPIHKKGSLLDCTNYRPISLLSNLSKLFEKAMHNRLYKFLEKCKSLYQHQYGFRSKHSTTLALIEITERIRKALDNKHFACGVFVDLEKAFDTVDHSILLTKLEYYGVRGIPLKWFSSYLNNRKQFVSINGTNSVIKKCSNGVPQGSVLGPLLFLIFINDLNTSFKFATAYHFADDTNMLLIDKSLKKINKYINHDLSNLVQWLRSNKLSLNCNKTELIIFKSSLTPIKKHLNFRLSGQKIYPVGSIKYLGIKIDSNLSFKDYLNDLAIKLRRSNGMLAKVRHYVNLEALLNIYHAIFGSRLRYACQIWGQSQKHNFSRLSHLQNKALKIIYFQSNNFKSSVLYCVSNILKLSDLIIFLNCQLVWNYHHHNLPVSFNNFYDKCLNCRYPLRSYNNLNLPVPKHHSIKYGNKSIKYQSISAWNNLPPDLKSLNSISDFKIKLFNHLLIKYK
jgi:hypothetical protein